MTTDRDHLDAETVAAWVDGGLDAASLAAAEAHASNCDRCRALLATVVKTEPVAARHEATGSARIWRWWLAPIAATAAAVTLWMVAPQEPSQPDAVGAPVPDIAAPAAGARAPEEAAPTARAAEPPAVSGQRVGESKARIDAQASPQRRQAVEGPLGAKSTAADAIAANRGQDRRDKAEERVARAEAEPARAPAAQIAQVAPASPASPVSPASPASPVVEVLSPNPRSRWRATADGIERSEDGGRIWLPVRLAQGEVITAGASPSPLACWLVGRRGLVLLATDGTNFTRLPFPEPVDLAAVSSPELRIAVVTAADGRVFRTEDAGRTWVRR